jgi:hypothetical protein
MKNLHPAKYRAVWITALLLCVMLWSPASGQKKKSGKPKRQQILFFDARLGLAYDDNIINYSDADLDLYGDNVRPDKFAIDSQDDWIVTSRISARLKGRFISGRTAWLDLRFNYHYYARNEVRRYQTYGLTGRHYFMRGGYGELAYSYLPDYYYRNQYYEGTGQYIEADFSKHFLKAEIGADILPSLKGDISYRLQRKFFNPEVRERDLTVHGVRLDGIWRAARMFKFWAFYGFQRGLARGADDPDPDVKDVSYDAWDITLGARHYSPFLGSLNPQLVVTVQYRKIKFQTIKYRDIYRFGRDDSNYEIRVGTSWQMPLRVRLDIDYRFQTKRVSLFDSSVDDLLEYDSNQVSFELNRGF